MLKKKYANGCAKKLQPGLLRLFILKKIASVGALCYLKPFLKSHASYRFCNSLLIKMKLLIYGLSGWVTSLVATSSM